MAEESQFTARHWRGIGFLSLVGGLAILWQPPSTLGNNRAFWSYLLACALVGFGIFVLTELSGFWSGRHEPSGDTDRKKKRATTAWQRKIEAERIRDEAERIYKERMRRLIVVALAIVVVLGLWFGSLWRASYQSRDRVDTELIALLGRTTGGAGTTTAGSGPATSHLQIDPELRNALVDYFRNAPKLAEGFPWWLVVIGALAVGALLFTMKEHPSAAPLVVVLPLAIAAVEHAEHLSKFCKGGFWLLAAVFFASAVALMVIGIRRELTRATAVDESGPGGEKKHLVSFVTMGFSMLILGWTFAVVGSCADCSGCSGKAGGEPPKCPSVSPPAGSTETSALKVIPLEPAPLFKAGHSEPLAGVDRLARSLEDESPKKGDILLLLGSADCTRYSKSNRQLALERASRISDELGPSLHGARVEDRYVLAQHGDGCKENMDLRSVFSFLIQRQETSK